MKQKFRKWFFLIPFIFAGALILFGWIIMLLWNGILVPVTGIGVVTLWQGLGLVVLSRILVGGFGGRGSRRSWQGKNKWMNMSPEEKEQFKDYCKSRWGKKSFENSESTVITGNDQ